MNEAFRESSSYYFIGFRAAADGSGKEFRKVEVKVNRPGAYVPHGTATFRRKKARATEIVNGLPSGDCPAYERPRP